MYAKTARISFALAMLTALGCNNAPEVENAAAANAHTGSEDTNGIRRSGGSRVSDDGGNGACDAEAVYFDYDSAGLDARGRDTAARNADCVNRRAASARVVGMTDPRGTEEYNLALGDRRARTVTTYMTQLGVAAERLDIRSVGEEMSSGEDESSWARDRRAQTEIR